MFEEINEKLYNLKSIATIEKDTSSDANNNTIYVLVFHAENGESLTKTFSSESERDDEYTRISNL